MGFVNLPGRFGYEYTAVSVITIGVGLLLSMLLASAPLCCVFRRGSIAFGRYGSVLAVILILIGNVCAFLSCDAWNKWLENKWLGWGGYTLILGLAAVFVATVMAWADGDPDGAADEDEDDRQNSAITPKGNAATTEYAAKWC